MNSGLGGLSSRVLDRRFAQGLAWTAGAKWTTQAITWASVLVAARLLSPGDYGLVEMGSVLFGLTVVLSEFGIGTAVLQMNPSAKVLAQLNTVSLLFSSLGCLLSILGAHGLAVFFGRDEIRTIAQVNSAAFLISGFQAVPQGLLQRDMDFRRLSLAEAWHAAIQATVTVGGAAAGWGYWALLAGPISGKATSAVLTAWWRPVGFAAPRSAEVAALLRFGWHVAAGRLAGSLYTQADGVVVGRVLGGQALGVYRLGVGLATAPVEKVGMLIMRVTGPLFAGIQSDLSLVRRYQLVFTESLTLAVFPLALGLAATAPEVIAVLLGAKWKGAAGPLRWVAIYMAVQPLATLAGQILVSLRHTSFTMWVQIWSLGVLPLAFWWASRWGPEGVAAAWLLMAPLSVVPLIAAALRASGCGVREYARALLPATVGCAFMLLTMLGGERLLPEEMTPPWRLGVKAGLGAAAYALILLTFYPDRVSRYVSFVTGLRGPGRA